MGSEMCIRDRPLRRARQQAIEDELSEKILHGELSSGDHIAVDVANGAFVFEHGPRGEKVTVGAGVAPAITATPDMAASGD